MMFPNVTFYPYLQNRATTSFAVESFVMFFHGGTTMSSVLSNRAESRRMGRGFESKPGRATIIGTDVVILLPVCVRW